VHTERMVCLFGYTSGVLYTGCGYDDNNNDDGDDDGSLLLTVGWPSPLLSPHAMDAMSKAG
jgi:hypothetical protein